MLKLWVAWTDTTFFCGVIGLKLIHSHSLVAHEVVIDILKKTGVPVRKHKSISVKPVRLMRRELSWRIEKVQRL